jgi:cell division protease FtsH
MSRFFKSAAFPILIVVVLAFFASKLVDQSNKATPPSFGTLVQEIDSNSVKTITLDQKDNSATVVLNTGATYTTGYPDSYAPTLINAVLTHEGGSAIVVQSKSTSGWLSLLTYVLPFALFLGFWLFIMNQVQGGGSKVMSFGKSRAKRMSVDSPKITFRDVAGVDEAVEELPGARRPHPQGGAALWPSRHRQDSARASRRRRSRRAVLLDLRLGLRRDVRRRRRLACA